MTTVRSYTVALRSGVSDATLPDNRKMKTGINYLISQSDYAKLSRAVRTSVVTSTVNTVDTLVPRWDGTNYSMDITSATFHNTAALPPLYTGAANKFTVGSVVQGLNGSAFKLVLLSTDGTLGNVNATTTKNVAVWISKNANTVTVKTSAAGNLNADFAGVFVGAVTAGNYGWIEIEGEVAAAAANASVTAGAPVGVNWATDGQVVNFQNDVQTLTLSAGGNGDTFKITFNGHEATVAVTIGAGTFTAVTAAQVQATMNSISDFALAANQPVVTGSAGGPFPVTFSKGAYANSNVGTLTMTSKTGAANGSFAHTNTGSPYTGANGTTTQTDVATALTNSAATVSDIAVRSKQFARRHIKTAKLFFDAR